jgi:hypothetical protein
MPDYGLDIAIPFTGDPDPTLPWADDDDQLLVPGSLFMIDFAHSAAPTTSIPANGAGVQNLAWKRLKDQLGSGDAASLAMIHTDNHQTADATFEMTPKGGLHRMYSQVGNTANGRQSNFEMPPALEAYLLANPGHSYYLSDWTRITRMAASGGLTQLSMISASASTSNYLVTLQDTVALPGGTLSPPAIALGPRFRAATATGWTGTPAASAASLQGPIAMAGNGGAFASIINNKCGSYILYRTYLEDLTVSGRSYAKVLEQDQALYAAAFAAGGRFYGDTFTAPAN